MFGKRRTGALGPLSSVALLPYVVYTWAIWHLVRLLSREPAVDRLTDDIRIGRRLLPREVPDDVAAIIDLTCELPEPAGVMRGRVYRSIPILDGTAPPVDWLATAAIDAKALPRPVLVHCAQGHGRTGMFAIAMLLVEGTASSAAEALELLCAARPRARLNAAQHRVVEALAGYDAGQNSDEVAK